MLKTSVLTWCFNASIQNIIMDALYGVGTILGSRIEGYPEVMATPFFK